MITVNVRFFATVKDLVGADEIELMLEEGALASRVLDHLAERYPRLSGWRKHLRLAVNSEYAEGTRLLQDGDEVAIIPPVSGG